MNTTNDSASDNRTNVLLLAAGVGTRLRPLTDTTPKCLVPVAGRPLLDYWFDRFAEGGIRDVLINTHHLRDQVRLFIDRVNEGGRFRVVESYEPQLLGSAGTVHANGDFARDGQDCLIVYADNLSDVDLAEMMRMHRLHDDPITMMLFHAPNPQDCGIAELDESGRIVGFVEKPSDAASDLANGGVYALTAEAYRQVAGLEVFDLASDALPAFVGRMRGWIWEGYHRDIGTPEALRQAQIEARRVFRRRMKVEA